MEVVCQISGEPGGDLVRRNSRLMPNEELWVKKAYWDAGYEPRGIVVVYGQSLIDHAKSSDRFTRYSADINFQNIIRKKLYFGEDITMAELLPLR